MCAAGKSHPHLLLALNCLRANTFYDNLTFMGNPCFDPQEAKEYLYQREKLAKDEWEKKRQQLLSTVIGVLKEELSGQDLEAFLVGSLIKPYAFTESSDVDIVLINFHGDRFSLWSKLEQKIECEVEIILYEKCSFQEFVLTEGLKVL